MTNSKPEIGKVFNPEAIPSELKAMRRWAVWKAVWNDTRGKYDKIPYHPHGYGLSTKQPDRWLDFETAYQALKHSPAQYAGLGFVLTGVKDVVGIDLDHCVDHGKPQPWAQAIVDAVGGYSEISPSGTGLRILAAGSVDGDWANHDIGIEVYGGHTGRFLTITGDQGRGYFGLFSQDEINNVVAQYRVSATKPAAEVVQLQIPELIPDLALPDPDTLPLPESTLTFLLQGPQAGEDNSEALHMAGVRLLSCGLTDQQAFSMLAANPYAMEIALAHRHDNVQRALQYLWVEHVQKAKSKARPIGNVLDDFEDCSTGAAAASPAAESSRFRIQDYAEFSRPRKQSWFIKKVMPQADLAMVYGESTAGKSFFVLDLVSSISRGVDWRGHKVTKSKVLYLCAEGQEDFRRRTRAYVEHFGCPDFEMRFIEDAPNLMDVKDTSALLKQIKRAGDFGVIVIDTLAQAMAGGNENSSEDMGKVLAHCRSIARATGAMILFVHHSGKDAAKGARGWSGLFGAADMVIEVARDGDARQAELIKLKGGQEGAKFGFRLVPVRLGTDEDGDDITSCVIAEAEVQEQTVAPKGDNQKAVMDALREIIDLTETNPTVTELAAAAVSKLPRGESARDRRQEVVHRAIHKLSAEGGVLISAAGIVSLP